MACQNRSIAQWLMIGKQVAGYPVRWYRHRVLSPDWEDQWSQVPPKYRLLCQFCSATYASRGIVESYLCGSKRTGTLLAGILHKASLDRLQAAVPSPM